MRILVCGGRNFANPIPYDHSIENKKAMDEYKFVHKVLNIAAYKFSSLKNDYDNYLPSDIVIISGNAKGVDSAAADWAIVNYVQLEEYPADWDKYGKSAGYIRNKQMLDEGKPDLVIAFPGGKGTAMMMEIARKAGVKVREIKYERK